jgi:lipopolysaccharide export system protein LptA
MNHMIRAAALVLVAAAAPLAAQTAAVGNSALRGHDTRAPIDIDAARVEVRDKESQAIFTGSVKIRQGDMALDAASVRVFYERSAGNALAVRRVDAQGGVALASPSERARSAYGVYDVDNRVLTMIGDVVLNRGDSVLRGQRLAIDLDSGRSTLDGATSAANPNAGRVTGRFVVPPRTGG